MQTINVRLPAGASTPEGQARLIKAQHEQDQAFVDAANKLSELMRAFDWQPGKEKVIALLGEYFGDEEYGAQLLEECAAACRARATANENFLRAISGEPPVTKELRGW